MKEYYKQNSFKDNATLARKESEFLKETADITNKQFLSTFTSKMEALHIKTRKIKKMVAADLQKIYVGGQYFFSKSTGIQRYYRILEADRKKKTRSSHQKDGVTIDRYESRNIAPTSENYDVRTG